MARSYSTNRRARTLFLVGELKGGRRPHKGHRRARTAWAHLCGTDWCNVLAVGKNTKIHTGGADRRRPPPRAHRLVYVSANVGGRPQENVTAEVGRPLSPRFGI